MIENLVERNMELYKIKVDRRILIFIFLICVVFLYAFGVEGLLKSAPFGDDFGVFYRAGTLLLDGQDPWHSLIDSGQPFSYPPHTLAPLGLYATLPFQASLYLHTFLNLISLFLICWCANKWFLKINSLENVTIGQLVPLLLIVCNFYMTTNIYQGQLTLPCVAAMLMSWYFLNQGSWVVSGLLLGFATIKPQLAVFYVLWLLATLNIRVLAVGGGFSVLMCVPVFLNFGVYGSFESWVGSLSGYSGVGINALGSPFVVGLENIFLSYGKDGYGPFIKLLGLLFLVLLVYYKDRINHLLTAQLFFVLPLTFIYGKDYDYSSIVLLWSYILFLAFKENNIKYTVTICLMIFWFFMPQRFIRDIGFPLIVHFRSILLILCCFAAFYLLNKGSKVALGESRRG